MSTSESEKTGTGGSSLSMLDVARIITDRLQEGGTEATKTHMREMVFRTDRI